jgi:hypothetical protein
MDVVLLNGGARLLEENIEIVQHVLGLRDHHHTTEDHIANVTCYRYYCIHNSTSLLLDLHENRELPHKLPQTQMTSQITAR